MLAMDHAAHSTAYCLHGRMADGSYTRSGSVAMNSLRLGTKITVSRSPTGRHHFTVRDRIGYGSELDFWVEGCSKARYWGRHRVGFTIGWR